MLWFVTFRRVFLKLQATQKSKYFAELAIFAIFRIPFSWSIFVALSIKDIFQTSKTRIFHHKGFDSGSSVNIDTGGSHFTPPKNRVTHDKFLVSIQKWVICDPNNSKWSLKKFYIKCRNDHFWTSPLEYLMNVPPPHPELLFFCKFFLKIAQNLT